MPALARFVPVCSGLLLLLLAMAPVAQAQVCPGPITLSSQVEVDAFDCTEVTSGLTVSGPDIVNLAGLGALTSVGGNLTIEGNDALTNLTGLGGLTSVRGDLSLRSNMALTDLLGLGGLTSAGRRVIIWQNDALTNLDGLGGITSVGYDLRIWGNGALISLAGLGGVTSVGGYLDIGGNNALTSLLGLGGITSVGGLRLIDNEALTDLAGLDGLTSVVGDLTIGSSSGEGNDALTNLDALASVSSVGGALEIAFNRVLSACTVGLYDLITGGEIGGTITVGSNAPGCNSVEEILGAVSVEGEAPLVSGLAPAYPNPTGGAATLAYTLAEPSDVRLTIYDALGRRVATLVEGPHAAGAHEVTWDTKLPTGTYVVRFEAGGGAWSQRVTVVP